MTIRKVIIDEGFEAKAVSFPFPEAGGVKAMAGEQWLNPNIPDLSVEFLTEDHQKKKHKISGIMAQGLSFFSMILENSFGFMLPTGRSIDVVAPDAFIMHKALTFPPRGVSAKKLRTSTTLASSGAVPFHRAAQIKADTAALHIVHGWRRTAFKNIDGAYKDSTRLAPNTSQMMSRGF